MQRKIERKKMNEILNRNKRKEKNFQSECIEQKRN